MPRNRRHKTPEDPQTRWQGYKHNQHVQGARTPTENTFARLLGQDLVNGRLPDNYLTFEELWGNK